MYRLPDGNTTEYVAVYYRAWTVLARPICLVTGTALYEFDPGIVLVDPDEPDEGMATLPTWFAIRLVEALEVTRSST